MSKFTKSPIEHVERLNFDDENIVRKLSGLEHETLRVIGKVLNVRIGARGNQINIRGGISLVEKAKELIEQLGDLVKSGREIDIDDVRNAAMRMNKEKGAPASDYLSHNLAHSKTIRDVMPRGPGQRHYVDAMKNNDLVFAVGPAGTGKTYLAMTLAVIALKSERVSRIILTRPAVEAGEKLGFLPGNLEEKVSPYLRPLYDALFDLVGTERAEELVAHGVIEVAPLAFMRGRTLNDAFVILDEAQNTTPEQIKMALTRLGFGSKMVVTGDVTQIDLPSGPKSGLIEALEILQDVDGVSICKLSDKDVVRHPLVQSIVRAYDAWRKKV